MWGAIRYLDKIGEFRIAIRDEPVHFGLRLDLLLCAQRNVPLAQTRLALAVLQQQETNLPNVRSFACSRDRRANRVAGERAGSKHNMRSGDTPREIVNVSKSRFQNEETISE